MPAFLQDYTTVELFWIGLSFMLLGMAKGGFPIGTVALPLLVLVWPEHANSARGAVAFMLPMLCFMDIFAVLFYRRHIQWQRIKAVFPGAILGVAIATPLFVSESDAFLAFSDRALKIAIGVLGLLFVLYQAIRKWVLKRLSDHAQPGTAFASATGVAAGMTSTLAHAGGPVMQMYLLPQGLTNLQFAGTAAGFFFVLNLVKVAPFAVLGRFSDLDLPLAACVLPLLPLGVAAGYGLVRLMKTRIYIGFIYAILFITSVLLIWKAAGE